MFALSDLTDCVSITCPKCKRGTLRLTKAHYRYKLDYWLLGTNSCTCRFNLEEVRNLEILAVRIARVMKDAVNEGHYLSIT